jgi:membrane fusion protein
MAIGLISLLMATAIIAFLIFGSYTRRATVSGHLQPSTGVTRISSPQTGLILEKRVSDGKTIKMGEVLYVIDSERKAQSGAASLGLQQSISEQIEQRQKSLREEIPRLRQTQLQESSALLQRQATLKAEAQSIQTLIEQQRQRVSIAEDTRQRYQGLAEKDYIAGEQLTQKKLELSEQSSRLQTLQRDLITNQREQINTRREIDSLADRYALQVAQLQRNMSLGNQELAEVQTRSRVLVTSPHNGQATLVSGEAGQTVEPGKTLLTLLPENASLVARLYVPSRHMGFVRVGDQVLLRYEAYPYQMFGQHTGKVSSISSAPASVAELESANVAVQPATEPVYVVQVELTSQTIAASGAVRALQSGARFEADLLQETRKLWQWMLEPLYTMTKKAAP